MCSKPCQVRNYRWAAFLFVLSQLATVVILAQQTEALRQEDQTDYYSRWLDEDVVYIITPQERGVFSKLTNDEERDAFIEQFWRRRDSGPSTAVNETKTEHYRRIAYANERFDSGYPGWRSDRGMIYIKFGPPTGIEKYPQGGFYARKFHEGQGFTSVYPFEIWFYNHLPGVGDGVEIEFVDASKTNEYKIATHPDEKDALIHVPGAGMTLGEQLGAVSRLDRLRFRHGTVDHRFEYRTARDFPLQRLEQLYKLQKAPATHFADFQKKVETRIGYELIPFEVRIDQFRISDTLTLVPVTLIVEEKHLTYIAAPDQTPRATLDVYGKVESIQGELVYSFEETVQHRRVTSETAEIVLYQQKFPLQPGRYKLSLIVRDHDSGRIGSRDQRILISRPPGGELSSSSLVLTPRVERVADDDLMGDPFVITRYKVKPVASPQFALSDRFVQSYFEVYNLGLDQSTSATAARVEIALQFRAPRSQGQFVDLFPFTVIEREFEQAGDTLMIYNTVPFDGLISGEYKLLFRVTDLVKPRSLRREVQFRIR